MVISHQCEIRNSPRARICMHKVWKPLIQLAGVCLLSGCGEAPGPGTGLVPLSIDDAFSIATPTSTQLSPDGRRIAFTLVKLVDGSWQEGVHVVETDGTEGREIAGSGDTPRWTPDGSHLAWINRAARPAQVWVASIEGEDRRQLTELEGGVSDFAWAPDGKALAVTTPVKEGDRARTQIALVHPGEKARQLTHTDQHIIVHAWEPDANLSWSPDGRFIAYSTKPSGRFDDDYASDVHVVEVGTGKTRAVVKRPGMDMRPRWSPGGGYIAFRTSFGLVDRFANHGLGVVRVDDGVVQDGGREFEGGFLDGPYTYVWADSQVVLFLGSAGFDTRLFALDARTGKLQQRSREPGTRSQLSGGWPSGQVAYAFTTAGSPWEVSISPVEAEERRNVTRLNPGLADRALPMLKEIEWESPGVELQGLLALPADYSPSRRYPVITLLHGGPEGNARYGFSPELPSPIFSFAPDEYFVPLLVAEGFAVFLPNFRGSGGRGEQFRRAGNGSGWAERFSVDVLAGLDKLVATGIADSMALGIAGSRSGATKVVAMLGRTKRFRAASVVAPYPDFVRDFEKAGGDFHLMFEGMAGTSGPGLQAFLEREQPMARVDSVETPLQIITDEAAFSIDTEQSLALHRALWRRQVPGEVIVTRGGDVAASKEQIRRTTAWFRRWLKSSEQ
jgi:dipeptidyl aminopeptidase/acylaminoacyl peptidase